jgi:very-short-patch-repair endonuclease
MADATSVSPVIHGKRTQRPVDRRIAELAERQHGIVARRQLLGLGLGRSAIESRLARGQLHRIRQGAYAVGHRSLTRYGQWMAAVLSAGPRAVLSHRSAAQLWQLLPMSSIAVEITRPTRFRSRHGIGGHCSPLPPDEVTIVHGIPVTAVPRTALDLAATSSKRQVEKALNEIEVHGLADRLSIPDLLERYPRRQGTAMLRAVLADDERLSGITRNELEGRFAALLEATDLPRPRLNAHVAVRGRFFEADCLWAEQKVIVELDGGAVHRTRRAFEKDRERDRLLLTEGWRVIRITWRQLREDARAVIADLGSVLRCGRPPTL